jgi:hypothetical protein
MNSQLMEFFGNYLIQAARWQKLVEQFSPEGKPDVKDIAELGRLFQKACGIDGTAELAFAEYSRIWQQMVESIQPVFCSYAKLWGWVPQADYQVLQEKCDALENKIQDQDRIISYLRTLLDEKGMGQIELLDRFQSLIQNQSDEFQTFMQNFGEVFTKDGKG